MACIRSIDGYVYDCAHVRAVVPLCSDGLHHLAVAYAYEVVAHAGLDALSCNLFHIAQLAAVGSLVGEGIAQGGTDGVGREVFYVGGQMQQLVLVAGVGMYGSHGKLPVRQSARLVEDHRLQLCQHIHVVAALDEDAPSRGTADAAKERERHADDERTGTRHDKEQQGTVEPGGKVAAQ